MGTALIIGGITAFCFLLIYMFFKLNDVKTKSPDGTKIGHFLLQLIVLLFLLSSLILLGKATLDGRDSCSFVNTNTTIEGGLTSYNYDYICEADTKNTVNIFYYVVVSFVSLTFLYLFISFIYSVLVFLGWVVPK